MNAILMNAILMKCGCAAQGHITAIKGVPCDPIPGCLVHNCTDPAETLPNLEGRQSRCTPKCKLVPSRVDLPFFEFRGEGSREAVDICVCGYHKVAHENGLVRCRKFTPKGAQQYDKHYCGCMGWD